MRRHKQEDEQGVMAVLEAILVALLVLTAILFVSNVQRPLMGSESGGVDLQALATQTLSLLQRNNFTDSRGAPFGFETWLNRTMAGNLTNSQLGSDYLAQVLPEGTRHLLLISNGHGTLRLAPVVDPGAPRNARAAEAPFFPHWTKFRSNATAGVNAAWGHPGQNVTTGHPVLADFTNPASAIACIKAPNNSTVGPQGVPWLTYWRQSTFRVPDGALYGVWAGYTDASCTTGPSYARVAPRDGTLVDYPIYGIRLVVWFGT